MNWRTVVYIALILLIVPIVSAGLLDDIANLFSSGSDVSCFKESDCALCYSNDEAIAPEVYKLHIEGTENGLDGSNSCNDCMAIDRDYELKRTEKNCFGSTKIIWESESFTYNPCNWDSSLIETEYKFVMTLDDYESSNYCGLDLYLVKESADICMDYYLVDYLAEWSKYITDSNDCRAETSLSLVVSHSICQWPGESSDISESKEINLESDCPYCGDRETNEAGLDGILSSSDDEECDYGDDNGNDICSSDCKFPLKSCLTSSDCDDNSICTIDNCILGICNYNKISCNDFDSCTTDSCDSVFGCLYKKISGCVKCSSDSDCDDEDLCNGIESCSAGVCQTGYSIDCDDNNPCTDDACNPLDGTCLNEDNSICGESCLSNYDCDDGNFCNGAEVCGIDGKCIRGDKVDCSSFTDQCNSGGCDENLDKCISVPLTGMECDDNNLCTESDICGGDGKCEGLDKSCDDGVECTLDSCDSKTGDCINNKNSAESIEICNDGKKCTIDSCVGKNGDKNGCSNLASDVLCQKYDSNPNDCAEWYCNVDKDNNNNDGCSLKKTADGTGCDDKNSCTQVDKCSNGKCTGNSKCEDNNLCTLDGCKNSGECVNIEKNCEDGNPCTQNSCSLATGNCQSIPVQDGMICGIGDCFSGVCSNGVCQFVPITCIGSGTNPPSIVFPPINPGLIPPKDNDNDEIPDITDEDDDNDGINDADDSNPENPLVPGCLSDSDCEDDNLCTYDSCVEGYCINAEKICDDGDDCTDDSCDSNSGCVYISNLNCINGEECDNGNECDSGLCVAGSCIEIPDNEECIPDCEGQECGGEDGCGGNCGYCDKYETCIEGEDDDGNKISECVNCALAQNWECEEFEKTTDCEKNEVFNSESRECEKICGFPLTGEVSSEQLKKYLKEGEELGEERNIESFRKKYCYCMEGFVESDGESGKSCDCPEDMAKNDIGMCECSNSDMKAVENEDGSYGCECSGLLMTEKGGSCVCQESKGLIEDDFGNCVCEDNYIYDEEKKECVSECSEGWMGIGVRECSDNGECINGICCTCTENCELGSDGRCVSCGTCENGILDYQTGECTSSYCFGKICKKNQELDESGNCVCEKIGQAVDSETEECKCISNEQFLNSETGECDCIKDYEKIDGNGKCVAVCNPFNCEKWNSETSSCKPKCEECESCFYEFNFLTGVSNECKDKETVYERLCKDTSICKLPDYTEKIDNGCSGIALPSEENSGAYCSNLPSSSYNYCTYSDCASENCNGACLSNQVCINTFCFDKSNDCYDKCDTNEECVSNGAESTCVSLTSDNGIDYYSYYPFCFLYRQYLENPDSASNNPFLCSGLFTSTTDTSTEGYQTTPSEEHNKFLDFKNEICTPCKSERRCSEDEDGNLIIIESGGECLSCSGECSEEENIVEICGNPDCSSCKESENEDGTKTAECIYEEAGTSCGKDSALFGFCTNGLFGMCETIGQNQAKYSCDGKGKCDFDLTCTFDNEEVSASPEICDGIDNDCDGETDEGEVCCLNCGEEECSVCIDDGLGGCDYSNNILYGCETGICYNCLHSCIEGCTACQTCNAETGMCENTNGVPCLDYNLDSDIDEDGYNGYCISGACFECISDEQCSDDEECINGYCKYEYLTPEDCPVEGCEDEDEGVFLNKELYFY